MNCCPRNARLRVCAVASSQPAPESRRPSSLGPKSTRFAPTKLPNGPNSQNSSQNFVSCSSAAVLDARTLKLQEKNEFRRGVGLCVVNSQGLVFAAKRMDDTANTWQMPQGGIDPYENPLMAALRELKEETGMTSVRIVSSIDRWLEYEWTTKVRCHLSGNVVKYKGQTQKWLLLHFHGNDDEIDISCHGVPEFSEWKWMQLEELPHSVVEFKRGVYHAVAGHFGPAIQRLIVHSHNNLN